MSESDKVVAAILAAGMCSKVNASAKEYVAHYREFQKLLQESEHSTRVGGAPRSAS